MLHLSTFREWECSWKFRGRGVCVRRCLWPKLTLGEAPCQHCTGLLSKEGSAEKPAKRVELDIPAKASLTKIVVYAKGFSVPEGAFPLYIAVSLEEHLGHKMPRSPCVLIDAIDLKRD